MSEVKEIKQSANRTQVVGTLKEMNLQQETKELDLSYGDKKKKVTCEVIGKKDWSNPMFLVEVNGQDVGVEMFGASEKKLDENGKIVDNKRFKALQTILNTYVPKIDCKGEDKPTRVQFDGGLSENSYVKDGEDFKAFTQITAFKGTHNGVPDEDYAKGEITGIIKNILPEVRVVNEEEIETGRSKIEFYYFDRNANTFPVNFVVEPELADDLSGFYEVGDSCKLYYDIVVKQVGGSKPVTSGGFGKREAVTTGFNITEYSIVGGDDKFEEESEYFIEIDQMKEALNARQIMMDTKIEEAKKKAESPKEKKADPKSFGKKDGVKGNNVASPFD